MAKKAYFFADNATEMIDTIRGNTNEIKSSLCDAFAAAVFCGCNGNEDTWTILKTLQEYVHLIDTLTEAEEKF